MSTLEEMAARAQKRSASTQMAFEGAEAEVFNIPLGGSSRDVRPRGKGKGQGRGRTWLSTRSRSRDRDRNQEAEEVAAAAAAAAERGRSGQPVARSSVQCDSYCDGCFALFEGILTLQEVPMCDMRRGHDGNRWCAYCRAYMDRWGHLHPNVAWRSAKAKAERKGPEAVAES